MCLKINFGLLKNIASLRCLQGFKFSLLGFVGTGTNFVVVVKLLVVGRVEKEVLDLVVGRVEIIVAILVVGRVEVVEDG